MWVSELTIFHCRIFLTVFWLSYWVFSTFLFFVLYFLVFLTFCWFFCEFHFMHTNPPHFSVPFAGCLPVLKSPPHSHAMDILYFLFHSFFPLVKDIFLSAHVLLSMFMTETQTHTHMHTYTYYSTYVVFLSASGLSFLT